MSLKQPGIHVWPVFEVGDSATRARIGINRTFWAPEANPQELAVIVEYKSLHMPDYIPWTVFKTFTGESFDSDGKVLAESWIEFNIPPGRRRRLRTTLTIPRDAVDTDLFSIEKVR